MGYSFITIGVVRMMGFQLQIHIEKPYFAVSVTDFGWRWYISLSSCSRDYFSIPLGRNRVKRWRDYRNIMETFFISGLWHGAAYNLSFGEDYMGCFK